MAKTPKRPAPGRGAKPIRQIVSKMIAKGGDHARALQFAAGVGAGKAMRNPQAFRNIARTVPRPPVAPMARPPVAARAPVVTRSPMVTRPVAPAMPARRPMLPPGGLLGRPRPRGGY